MPSEDDLARWQRALISVYFHGRRHQLSDISAGTERKMMSLDDAVDALLEVPGFDQNHAHPAQIAFADLMRSRAMLGNSRFDRHIERLRALITQGVDDDVQGFSTRFTSAPIEMVSESDASEPPPSPDEEFEAALGLIHEARRRRAELSTSMLAADDAKRVAKQSFPLISFSAGPTHSGGAPPWPSSDAKDPTGKGKK